MRTFDRTNPAKLADALRASLSERAPTVEAAEGAVPAGVLVPLQLRGDRWHVILNRRSDHVRQHAGEIAFPGGRLEPSDSDMQECALRESWEEMGIRPSRRGRARTAELLPHTDEFPGLAYRGSRPPPLRFRA